MPGYGFRFKANLYSLDATMIEQVPVAVPVDGVRQTKGAVKVHVGLDHGGHRPTFVRVTDGKTPDIGAARALRLPIGSIVAAGLAAGKRDRPIRTIRPGTPPGRARTTPAWTAIATGPRTSDAPFSVSVCAEPTRSEWPGTRPPIPADALVHTHPWVTVGDADVMCHGDPVGNDPPTDL